jgi:hypothetical protein
VKVGCFKPKNNTMATLIYYRDGAIIKTERYKTTEIAKEFKEKYLLSYNKTQIKTRKIAGVITR